MDAELYSIVPGNSLVINGLRVFILAVDGDKVTLASETAKSVKTVGLIIRWIDRGMAVVCSSKGA